MTKQEVVDLWNVLNDLSSLKGPVKFGYAVSKNKRLLQPEVQAIQEATRPKAEFMEFEKARLKLAEKYCERDKDGKPKMVKVGTQTHYTFSNLNRPLFEAELHILGQQHQEVLESKAAQDKEVQEFLLSKSDKIKLHSVRLEDCPADGISADQIDVLLDCGILIDSQPIERTRT